MRKLALTQFQAKPEAEAPTEAPRAGRRARGTQERTSIPVRVSQDDWIAMHQYALQKRKSLNRLLIEGFQELQRRDGLEPIKGE
jgi:hypothetical protein